MNDLVKRIEKALEHSGYSWSGASVAIGLSAQAPAKWKKGQIGRDTLSKLADLTKVNSGWLLDGTGEMLDSEQANETKEASKGMEARGYIGRWVPVKAYSKMGSDGFFTDMGYAGNGGDGWVPSTSAGPNAYAVKGSGGSMHPAVRDGWYCVCDPDAPPVNGEYVQVCLRDGRCTIKEFISLQNNLLTLLAVNSGDRWTFELNEVECISAITDIVPPSRHRHEYPGMPIHEVEYHF